jgi:hypothetical protein
VAINGKPSDLEPADNVSCPVLDRKPFDFRPCKN